MSALKQLSAAYCASSEEDEEEDEEEGSPKAQVIAKAQCSVCAEAEHKYRCPRCQVLTCSLACVKSHKI